MEEETFVGYFSGQPAGLFPLIIKLGIAKECTLDKTPILSTSIVDSKI